MGSDDYMTQIEAADYIRVHPATLRRMREAGKGPPYVRVNGAIRYKRSAIDAWADAGGDR